MNEVPREETTYETTPPTRPMDGIRWGPVLGGVFAALAVLLVLTVLGLAIGLSTYTPGTPVSNLSMSAGIWGILSVLIAFLIGGWLASYTAAMRGRWGVLNGAMVWVVALPLLLYVATMGVMMMPMGMAGNTAGSAAANPSVTSPTLSPGETAVPNTATGNQGMMGQNLSGQQVEQVARTAAPGAWAVLIALVLGFLASLFGGWLGARREMHVGRTTTTTAAR